MPRDFALVCTLTLGLLHDLLASVPPGLHAFSYSLTAILFAHGAYRPHPVTVVLTTVIAQLITGLTLQAHAYSVQHVAFGMAGVLPMFSTALWAGLLSACTVYPLAYMAPRGD